MNRARDTGDGSVYQREVCSANDCIMNDTQNRPLYHSGLCSVIEKCAVRQAQRKKQGVRKKGDQSKKTGSPVLAEV